MKYFILSLLSLALLTSSCKKESLVPEDTMLEEITNVGAYDAGIKVGVSIVFFHATWCTKCASQRPAVEELTADSRFSSVYFGQVDFEKNETIVNKADVTGFPTILIFKDGIEKARYEGTGHSKATIESKLLEIL